MFATAVYGGYFGAAQGVILIALLGILIDDELQRLNAVKNVLAGTVNATAAVIFIAFSHIAWLPAALRLAAVSASDHHAEQRAEHDDQSAADDDRVDQRMENKRDDDPDDNTRTEQRRAGAHAANQGVATPVAQDLKIVHCWIPRLVGQTRPVFAAPVVMIPRYSHPRRPERM